jgi:hypothetical protein
VGSEDGKKENDDVISAPIIRFHYYFMACQLPCNDYCALWNF